MRLADDLSCAELVELVTEYVDGALDPCDRERFEQHLVVCDGCANHLEQMRSTIEVVGRLEEADVGDEMAAELLVAFRGWKAS